MKHKKTPEEIKEYKRNYNKQRAEYLAEHNFCRWCGKQKALEGKALCWDCMNKSCEYGYKRYHSMTEEERKAQRQKNNEYRRVRYQIRKEKGLCTQCGKRKPMGGQALCITCRNKKNQQALERRRKQGKITMEERGNGIYCLRCCKPVEVKGKTFCSACYQMQVKKAEYMRSKCKTNEHIWHGLNNLVFNAVEGGDK